MSLPNTPDITMNTEEEEQIYWPATQTDYQVVVAALPPTQGEKLTFPPLKVPLSSYQPQTTLTGIPRLVPPAPSIPRPVRAMLNDDELRAIVIPEALLQPQNIEDRLSEQLARTRVAQYMRKYPEQFGNLDIGVDFGSILVWPITVAAWQRSVERVVLHGPSASQFVLWGLPICLVCNPQ
ncbi:hypothetical protein C8T65DRAFT_751182 [Cerioporus squamosus]|nr:hypothetical protein C8T65DRAFT_751182 [Cerioporus squamosus]